MSPSYKSQIGELTTALAASNASVSVLKTQERNARQGLITVYRAVGAVWGKLASLPGHPAVLDSDPGFLTAKNLNPHNIDVMTDHILAGLEGILRGCGELALTSAAVGEALSIAPELIQTHHDGVEAYDPLDLSSPLLHLTNALDWLEKEDQQLRAQVRTSQAARLSAYETSLIETDVGGITPPRSEPDAGKNNSPPDALVPAIERTIPATPPEDTSPAPQKATGKRPIAVRVRKPR